MLVEASTSEATLDAKQVTETVSAAPSSGYLIPADPIQQPATARHQIPAPAPPSHSGDSCRRRDPSIP